MEDAHLSVSPLSDKKSSLFAVFDGHGGTNLSNYKGPKSPYLFKETLLYNFRQTLTLKKVITSQL